jgi:hypothetical protein
MQRGYVIGGCILASDSTVTLLSDYGIRLRAQKSGLVRLIEFAGTYPISIFLGGRGIC